MKLFFSILTFFLSLAIYSQKHTVSGSIKNATDGEDLIGVVISTVENPSLGTVTNSYGFYSLSLPQGEYTLVYKYVGFNTIKEKINLTESIRKDIELKVANLLIKEVSIKAEKENANIKSLDMGIQRINPKDMETIPVLFGEKDLMKTVQLLPGISPAGEGQSGFFVRGGTPDQNLILLDESSVYNASHLLGFFSVFNSSAIKSLDIYKGLIPTKFGGRLSSVVDIKMKEGTSKKRLSGKGSIGLISSKLLLEGAIKKNKGSFMISGRRTYVDLFTPLSSAFGGPSINDTKLYFYDLNAKANYRIGKNDRLFISGYLGRDVFAFSALGGINWGNKTLTLRWNHIFSDKLFVNTSYIYSDFDYEFSLSSVATEFKVTSRIIDNTFRQDYNYYLNANNTIGFGGTVTYRDFDLGDLISSSSSINSNNLGKKNNLESSLYLENEQKLSDVLSLRYGLRYTNLTQFGPGTIYSFNNDGEQVDEKDYKRGEVVSSYNLFSPRFGATYLLNENSSIKASYSRTYQSIHLLSSPNASSPFDSWLPSSNNLRPSSSDQFSLGYFKNYKESTYKFSAEVYYKNEHNLKEYKTDVNIIFNPRVEQGIYSVIGRSYGLELLLKKAKGKLTGWISYTLSRTERQHNEINNGDYFSARQDRTHDISLVAMYSINERWKVSSTFVYYTGNAITNPSNQFYVQLTTPVPYYTGRNKDRFPDYHRLDIGVTLEGKKYTKIADPSSGEIKRTPKRFISDWNFSIYNVYAFENAYTITTSIQRQQTPSGGLFVNVLFDQLSLFRMVPSISWNFKL